MCLDPLAKALAERDRQYEYNVEQIAKQAQLEKELQESRAEKYEFAAQQLEHVVDEISTRKLWINIPRWKQRIAELRRLANG